MDGSKIMGGTDTILVTGGAGYIGAHACKALAAAGYRPVVLDNLVYGHRWAVQWGPLEVGDFSDRECLDDVFERHQPAAVMHFSAYTYVGESVTDPGRYYTNNTAGTLALLCAMRDHGIAPIVFSSTCATYGMPVRVPIAEDHPQAPINPYGTSKLMVEWMLRDFSAAHGMRYAALRYFNAAGADAEGAIGECHDPETHLIPVAMQAVLGKRPRVEIFGTDYDTPDGTAVRDYIHVTDLANAHLLALERLLAGGGNLALNLGTGTGYSVREIIAAVERASGSPVPVREAPRRAGDPPVLLAAADEANRVLGWQPRFSNLENMVASAWRWHAGGERPMKPGQG